MNEIKLVSYAKINLFLDILNKRNDGYHNIKSVMQTISLKDDIIIKNYEQGIKVRCSNPKIPTDISNTVYKAALYIKECYKINKGVFINIEKNIPTESGMAGGSSNAAAVIKGLNKLWSLNMSEDKMKEIGLKVGADVPFCLVGGTALVEGIGEKLTRLNPFTWDNILLVRPNFSMSTALVYKNLEKSYYNKHSNNPIIKYIEEYRFNDTANNLANTLENVVCEMNPEIIKIKESMINLGAVNSIMTGSGSVVFGLFENYERLINAEKIMKKEYNDIYIVETVEEI